MTDEELKRIEDEGCGCVIASGYGCAADQLVAEVRRLRALIALVPEISGPACPWCEVITNVPSGAREHDTNCSAFTPDGKVR